MLLLLKGVGAMIQPRVHNVMEFLYKHLEKDMEVLGRTLDLNLDDAAITIHLILDASARGVCVSVSVSVSVSVCVCVVHCLMCASLNCCVDVCVCGREQRREQDRRLGGWSQWQRSMRRSLRRMRDDGLDLLRGLELWRGDIHVIEGEPTTPATLFNLALGSAGACFSTTGHRRGESFGWTAFWVDSEWTALGILTLTFGTFHFL